MGKARIKQDGMEIVKVQLPLGAGASTGPILVYAEGKRHVCHVQNDVLRKAMTDIGLVKAFLWGKWDGSTDTWTIDLRLGQAPDQDW